MNKIEKSISFILIIIVLSFINCNTKKPREDLTEPLRETVRPTNKVKKNVDYEAIYDSLVKEYKAEIITEKEFKNFRRKSNYINTIEAHDLKYPPELFGGKEFEDKIRYYELPSDINMQQYGSNGIIFGDLNGDNKRDCIVSVFRSDGYNEVTFFYVFINYGTKFKLEDVTNEGAICGCKKEGWPNRFRYQIIKDGFFQGISQCHHQDAHCCPSLYFKSKVEFSEGKLKFYSSKFVMDDATKYRPTPEIK